MKEKFFITCAVTGAGDSVGRTPRIPVPPKETAAIAFTLTQMKKIDK